MFNVAINGVTVLPNFDIFQTAGANTALVETFPVAVTSGQIVIQFHQREWTLRDYQRARDSITVCIRPDLSRAGLVADCEP